MLPWMQRLFRSDQAEKPFGDSATREDITACFRLLLGRAPNPTELAGHMAQAGRPLPRVVAGYINSLEFARRGLMNPDAGGPAAVMLEGYRLYASADDAAVGQHVIQKSYEPEVHTVFCRLLRPGMGVVDLGANIGYLKYTPRATWNPF